MKMIAKLNPDGSVAKYPYRRDEMVKDFPNTSFPKELADSDIYHLGLAEVHDGVVPEYDPLTHILGENEPKFKSGLFYRDFYVVPGTTQWVIDRKTEIANSFVVLVQQRLDEFARTRNYDGILSACTYLGSPVPQFHIEAEYAIDVRARTWATMYSILAQVEAGTLPMPKTFDEVAVMLPVLEWPAQP